MKNLFFPFGEKKELEIKQQKYSFETDWKIWLKYFFYLKQQKNEEIFFTILEIFPLFLNFPQDEQVYIIEELNKYMLFDAEPLQDESNTTKQNKPTFDLFFDEQQIISDFQREYHLNLLDDDLHISWWRFKCLLNNLKDDSSVRSYIKLREMNINEVDKKYRGKLKKAQKSIEITDNDKQSKKKMTLEERNEELKRYYAERIEKARGVK